MGGRAPDISSTEIRGQITSRRSWIIWSTGSTAPRCSRTPQEPSQVRIWRHEVLPPRAESKLARGGLRSPVPVSIISPQPIRCRMNNKVQELKKSRVAAALHTPTDLSPDAVRAVSEALNALLADTLALYVKTKNFHWHVSGPHFRSYHLLLDEQSQQILETVDELAERVRKIAGATTPPIRAAAQ